MSKGSTESYVLDNGAKIAVIGGGPTGSFFSIFALKMAKMLDKEINLTIFEPKDFTKEGPASCNRCGGIISELLVQTLAVEGMNLPDSVVQRGINSYELHTDYGSVHIATPSLEKKIATVYRGGGPKGMGGEKESFDNFLVSEAVSEGAVHERLKIDSIVYRNKRPVLYSQGQEIMDADLVVGAFGVNSPTAKIIEEINFGYKKPETVSTAIAELGYTKDVVDNYFGKSVHLFLLPLKNIKFAAMIPKQSYVTLCILGRDINANTVKNFMESPVVREVLPDKIPLEPACRCLPKMNVRAPERPFADRMVMCGDAGSTRLFKDGIGAAYIMGKAAAKTAIFNGVSEHDFQTNYYPVYKSLIIDNMFGKFLYAFTNLYQHREAFTRMMLGVVRKEQSRDDNNRKVLSSILWDMFTGNERYKNVFFRAFDMGMNLDQIKELTKNLIRRDHV